MCLPWMRFRVADKSMQPAFNPGDFILINRWAYLFSSPIEGDAVIVKDPSHARRSLLKRIHKARNNQYYIRGDNQAISRDSRKFGPVSKKQVLGKVWIHIQKG